MKFEPIITVPINDKKAIVVSFGHTESSTNVVIAQKLNVTEEGKELSMFLKGSIQVPLDVLGNVRDALNIAIEKVNERNFEKS